MSLETDPNLVEQGEEDDTLEDFFNKKAKKGKKKKKKKVETGTDSATEAKESTSKAEPQQAETVVELDNNNKAAEEEWNDYEEEIKDYSDLKIQNLQISEPVNNPDEPEKEYNEAGELLPSRASEGPWNKKSGGAPVEQPVVTHAAPPAPEPVKSGAYRPPSMRYGDDSGSSMMRKMRMKKQQAPEIDSVMDFPSLAAAVEDKEPEKGFQMVKGGARPTQQTSNTGGGPQPWRSRRQQQEDGSGQLKLGNQFSALNTSRW